MGIQRRLSPGGTEREGLRCGWQWLAGAVAYLVRHQDPGGLWRYPYFGEPDVSNAQFALLALKAAQRAAELRRGK